MPYVVKVGKKGFLKQGRIDSSPTIYHHPSSCQKAIDNFESRFPGSAGLAKVYVWKRGVLSEVQ